MTTPKLRLQRRAAACDPMRANRSTVASACLRQTRRREVEDCPLGILEAQIRPDSPQGNSGCAKRCLRHLGIGNPQRHVVRLAQRLIAFGLKERQLRAVATDPDDRQGSRFVLDVETQDVAKPGHRTRQVAIANADMIYAPRIK
jgi:hypothetical protein